MYIYIYIYIFVYCNTSVNVILKRVACPNTYEQHVFSVCCCTLMSMNVETIVHTFRKKQCHHSTTHVRVSTCMFRRRCNGARTEQNLVCTCTSPHTSHYNMFASVEHTTWLCCG